MKRQIYSNKRNEKYLDPSRFNEDQLREIRKGLKSGVDISIYADPKFSGLMMAEIREGLEKGLDVSVYADPKFDGPQQMEQLRKGLESGVDVSAYADPRFGWREMQEIRRGLEKGLDVSVYADPKFDDYQMEVIRKHLEKEVNKSSKKSSKPRFSNFNDFYQRCWDALLDEWHRNNPEGEVDQNTQGGYGTTELYADGFGSGYYFSINESTAIANCEEVYDSNGTIEDGVEAIYDAGMEIENPDWED